MCFDNTYRIDELFMNGRILKFATPIYLDVEHKDDTFVVKNEDLHVFCESDDLNDALTRAENALSISFMEMEVNAFQPKGRA